MKILFLVAIFTVTILSCYSQAPELPKYQNLPSIQSPNAASLGKFGDIPVSLFNGLANISIPVVEIKNGPLSIPIQLQYDAGGCRPDVHPTWVGLNWSLITGGVIRRQTNGAFDEWINPLGGYHGYYDLYSNLATSNWHSGVDALGATAPDEFSFMVNGLSGTFMLNHEGKWIVKSKENLNLKISHEVQSNYDIENCNLDVPRTFTKFTLTAGDGTIYIFGRERSAIEFSIPAIPQLAEVWNTTANPPIIEPLGWQHSIQSSAWHLSEIIAPTGQRINFYYTTDYSFQQNTYTEISECIPNGSSTGRYTYDINQHRKMLIASSYIDSITTNNGISCNFSRSISTELVQQFKSNEYTSDIFVAGPPYTWRYYKLDNLKLKVNNKLVKKAAFKYIEKSTERLKLKEVNILSSDENNSVGDSYKMEYSDKLLPIYNKGYEDHWGFYNGKNFYGIQSYQGYTAIPNLDLYYQSREPDATFMDAEIIKRITYPTGGYSDFYFEPHTYATLVKQNPTLSLQTLSSNKLAGGLRIKRIEHYESSSPVSLVKEYFYVKDYMDGGTVSSGVLSGEPIYFQAGLTYYNNPYSKFSSLPFNYMNTSNGNHITYTQITEKSTEGYTVHTYTNQDNGYLDKNALTSVTSGSTSSSYQGKMFGKLELERGQPITIKQYADDKFLLREEVNEYNDDPNRYNNYVRSIYNLNDLNNAAYIMIAVPIYTFYPYLKRKIEREYFRSGGSFSIVTEFVYDPVSNLIRSKEVIRSDANKMKTTYKYPLDYSNTFTASSTDEAYDLRALRDANVVNIPVETTNIIVKGGADYVIDSEERYFENLKTERIFKLETVSPIAASNFSSTTVTSSGFISDSRYKEDILFTRYDDRGNVQEMIRQDGITVVYLWAYKSSYPVAKIVNATYNQVEIALGSTVLTNLFNSYDNAWIRSTLKNLKNSLTNAQVYTYIYEPLKGIISESDPYGKVTNYEYDKYSRLSLIKDDDNSIIKRYVYQTQQFKRLNLSTNTINFGSIPHVYTVSKTVRVTNSSNLPFTISSISKPSWCTYVINGSSTVLPGEYVEVTVTFTPTGISTYSGTLQVLSDAEGSNTITLNGIGLGTRVISISGNLNFGTVYGNMGGFPVTTRTFTIQNSGTGTLTVTGIESPFPGIMTLNWSSGTIGPGQSQVVTLTFAPVMESIYSGPINIVCDKTSGTNTITAEGWAIFNP